MSRHWLVTSPFVNRTLGSAPTQKACSFDRYGFVGMGLFLWITLAGCSKSPQVPTKPEAAVNGTTGIASSSTTVPASQRVTENGSTSSVATSAQAPAEPPPTAPTPVVESAPVSAPISVPAVVIVQRTAPAGTSLQVRLSTNLSSKNNNAGDPFSGQLASPVNLKHGLLLPAGSTVNGEVISAHSAGKFKGGATMSLKLTSIVVRGRRYSLQTASVSSESKGKGKRTGAMVGGGAGGGALIGGLAGGGKGALIGGLIGAGAGTAGAGMTGNNRDIVYSAETIVTFHLSKGLTITGS